MPMTPEQLEWVQEQTLQNVRLVAEVGKLFIDGMKAQQLPEPVVKAVYHYVANKLGGK